MAKIKPRKIGGQFFSDKVKFSCKFEYESNKPVYQLDFIYVFNKDTFQKYDILYNGSKLDFEDVDTVENISQNMPEIIYYSDFDLEVPTEIPFYTTAFKKKDEAVNTLKDAEEKEKRNNIPQWREILQDITNSLYVGKHISFQKDIVDYLDNDGDKNSFQDKLSGFSKHINEIITNKWLDSLPTQSSLKRIDFICDDIQRHDFKKRFAFKVISTKDNTFELSDRSKGCQWFFAFMLFTEFRKHRKPNTIFLLDEPASNLHSSIQEKVAEAINELQDKGTGACVLYSTHSPYLLDIENAETMYLVKNINAASEVDEASVEIDSFIKYMNEENKKENAEEIRPISDYFKLNLKKVKEYFERKSIPRTIKSISKKFLENAKNIKSITDVINFFKDLFV